MPTKRRISRAAAPLAAISVVAIVLRCIGLGYGLPAVYNPDEVAIMNRALGFAEGTLNPHNFLYPTLYFYVLFVWEGLWFLVGRVTGVFGSLAAFERAFFVDPSSIYLAGRVLTVVTGVATVAATYRLGRVLWGKTAGLAGALFLAVAPLAVRDAHYVKHDVPVTLLIVLSVASASRLACTADLRANRWRWILAGALAGLATSTHYYAIFVVVPIAVAALVPEVSAEALRVRISYLAAAAFGSAVAFVAGSPFLLLEPHTAVRDVLANRAIVVDRATSSTGAFGSLAIYGRFLAVDALGITAFALAVVGLILVLGMSWRRALVMLSFPATFLLFIANTVPASRYLNPVLPFAAVLAGVAIARASQRAGVLRLAAMAVTAVAIVEAGTASVHGDVFFRQTDTRTLALEWIVAHVPAGTSILVQPYSVPLTPSREGLVEALTARVGSPEHASPKFRRELGLTPYPAPAYRTIYLGDGGLDTDKIYVSPGDIARAGSLEPLRARSVTYVVLKRYNARDPSTSALVQALGREARLVASFTPYRAGVDRAVRDATPPFIHNTDARIGAALERPGPIIDIWTLN